MSRASKHHVPCPTCQTKNECEVFGSVNVSVDPELREKVLNFEINRFRCRSCDTLVFLHDELLYHDMRNMFMIAYAPAEDANMAAYDAPVKQMPEVLQKIAASLRTRRVRTRYQLIDKIRLFEAGLDDYVFEYMRYKLFQEQPEVAEYTMCFRGIKGRRLQSDVIFKGGSGVQEFELSDYERVRALFQQIGLTGDLGLRWAEVEPGWVAHVIDKMTS